ncbi:MAG TPA: hypothetical protein PKC91_10060 [Ignavibacteria bacterium]|nr:hypothetical protein [Ignavibacteria bacterium]
MKNIENTKFFAFHNILSVTEKKEFTEFLKLSFIKKPRNAKEIINILESNSDLSEYLNSKYSRRSQWNILYELSKSIEEYFNLKENISDGSSQPSLKAGNKFKTDLSKFVLKDQLKKANTLAKAKINFLTFREIYNSANKSLDILKREGVTKEFLNTLKLYSDFHTIANYFESISMLTDLEIMNKFYSKKTKYLNQKMASFSELNKFMEILSKNYPDVHKIFYVIYHLYISVLKPEEIENFRKAKSVFFKNIDLYSVGYMKEMFQMFINTSHIIGDFTNRKMDREIFELFEFKLKLGLNDDFQSVKIGGNHFRDYVLIAINSNEIEWADNFIKEYNSLLPSEIKNDIYFTSLAYLNLAKKKFVEAKFYINRIERKFFIYDIDFFRINICANYEQGNILEALIYVNKFRDLVRKSKSFPDTHKSGSKNFNNCIVKLIKYKELKSKKILIELENQVRNFKDLIAKNWIENQIEMEMKELKIKLK